MDAIMLTPENLLVNTFNSKEKRNKLSDKIILISLLDTDDEDIPIHETFEPTVWFHSIEERQIFNLRLKPKLFSFYKKVLESVEKEPRSVPGKEQECNK